MKRWGFHGMPASHGVTKTHRRPGNIGSGGNKARVMPGTKMPGHMGNRYRILRAQKVTIVLFTSLLMCNKYTVNVQIFVSFQIVRINTRYNVIWVLGQASAGETNSLVQFYDTVVPTRTCKALETTPHFPTYLPTSEDEVLPEELFVDDLHNFNDPTIMYEVEE